MKNLMNFELKKQNFDLEMKNLMNFELKKKHFDKF